MLRRGQIVGWEPPITPRAIASLDALRTYSPPSIRDQAEPGCPGLFEYLPGLVAGGRHGQAHQALGSPRQWARPDGGFERWHENGACRCGRQLRAAHGQGPPRAHCYFVGSLVAGGPWARHLCGPGPGAGLDPCRFPRAAPGKRKISRALATAGWRTRIHECLFDLG